MSLLLVLITINTILVCILYGPSVIFSELSIEQRIIEICRVWSSLVVFTFIQHQLLRSNPVTRLANYLGYHINRKVAALVVWAIGVHVKPGSEVRQSELDKTGKLLTIRYCYQQQWYQTVVPYQRALRTKMGCCAVNLVLDHGGKLDITMQPGIPYTVSAQQLGGVAIEAHNSAYDTIRTYHKDVVPHYLGTDTE